MNAPRRHFRLSGHSVILDPRRHALRADLADIALAGTIFAPHYAEPVMRSCAPAFTAIYDRPGGDQSSELLAGEGFALLDIAGGWAWGYSVHDHYVGYVKPDALSERLGTPPADVTGGIVETATQFIDMPYVWGGRGGSGIDCSGLIQRALVAVGIAAPRDSDMQQAELGTALDDNMPLARGDLVFFPGHVGIMADDLHLLHATRHHGKTIIEPLTDVSARMRTKHETAIVARKRITA